MPDMLFKKSLVFSAKLNSWIIFNGKNKCMIFFLPAGARNQQDNKDDFGAASAPDDVDDVSLDTDPEFADFPDEPEDASDDVDDNDSAVGQNRPGQSFGGFRGGRPQQQGGFGGFRPGGGQGFRGGAVLRDSAQFRPVYQQGQRPQSYWVNQGRPTQGGNDYEYG